MQHVAFVNMTKKDGKKDGFETKKRQKRPKNTNKKDDMETKKKQKTPKIKE